MSNTELDILKRRPVGKGAWRMEIREVLESERAGMALLRLIRLRHPNDTETLRLVAEAQEEAAERIVKLSDLFHYKESGNGSE